MLTASSPACCSNQTIPIAHTATKGMDRRELSILRAPGDNGL